MEKIEFHIKRIEEPAGRKSIRKVYHTVTKGVKTVQKTKLSNLN